MGLYIRSLAVAAALFFAIGGSAAASAAQDDFDDLERRVPGYHIRIEGATETIYQGKVLDASPRDITTASGGTHYCDGTNEGTFPTPGPTPTCALDQAAKLHNFTYDGIFDPSFNEFRITRIGPDSETSTEFWVFLVNYAYTPTGGCSYEIATGSHTLWAYNGFNAQNYLQLNGPRKVVQGQPFTLTVLAYNGGGAGVPIQGAQVGDQVSDANGQVSFTAPATLGFLYYKAEKSGSIRSNSHRVNVRRHLA